MKNQDVEKFVKALDSDNPEEGKAALVTILSNLIGNIKLIKDALEQIVKNTSK